MNRILFHLWSKISYDPKKYWEKRGEKFHAENIYDDSKYRKQEEKLMGLLSKLEFSTVFEFGCGYGRITELILKKFEIKEYHATDISPHLVREVNDSLKKYDNLETSVIDIANIHTGKKYDLVIGSEVLMHVKPNQINNTVEELIKHTKKYLVNVDWYELPVPKIKAGHNFVHEYDKIYKTKQMINNIQQVRVDNSPPTMIFCASINEK